MQIQFMPVPEVPQRCACGELLERECERDEDMCLDCQYERAMGKEFPLNQTLARVPAHI